MKKQLLFLSFCIIAAIGLAQVPYKMSYQTVVRNSSNLLVNNQQVGIKVSLLQGDATGTAVFTQLFTPTTNANGLASIAIGDTSPAFVNINWGSGPFFIKTEIDPTGGTNYSIEGVSELMSVPYAMMASNVLNQGLNTFILDESITNAEVEKKIALEVGLMTQNLTIHPTGGYSVLDFNKVKFPKSLIDIDMYQNFNYTQFRVDTFKCDKLEKVYGNCVINWSNNTSLQNLKTVLGWNVNISGLNSNSLPNLEYIAIARGLIGRNINCPKLKSCGGILEIYPTASLNFPALEVVGKTSGDHLRIGGGTSNLLNVDLPALKLVWGNIEITNSNVTSISFDFLNTVKGKLQLSNNKLTSIAVNKILHTLVTNNTVFGSLDISNQTPLAPPTGQGLIDKQTLITKGFIVTTD